MPFLEGAHLDQRWKHHDPNNFRGCNDSTSANLPDSIAIQISKGEEIKRKPRGPSGRTQQGLREVQKDETDGAAGHRAPETNARGQEIKDIQ